jgi:hypothetical protein
MVQHTIVLVYQLNIPQRVHVIGSHDHSAEPGSGLCSPELQINLDLVPWTLRRAYVQDPHSMRRDASIWRVN